MAARQTSDNQEQELNPLNGTEAHNEHPHLHQRRMEL